MPFRKLLTCLLVASATAHCWSQDKPERARLPKWDKFPSHVFFKDAFQEGLVGPRPANLGQAASAGLSSANQGNSVSNESKGFAWSELVSATTLEDEIKSLQIEVQKTITTPSRFTGGGYLEARRMFTELAALFAVVAEYDREVRWTQDSPLARDLFTRAAANTKTTSVQAFNEARERKRDLEELIRGGSLAGRKPEEKMNWELLHRGSLMKRFTTSDDSLSAWTSNAGSLERNADAIKHESELLMMFSAILTQEGMEDGDDDDYVSYSRKLADAAREVLEASEVGDADGARKAASNVGQSCVACHDDYRG